MKQTHTILVVDDEPLNVFLLKKILEIGGYKVLTAGSGAESLQIIKEVIPNLVLLDLMMPGINGFKVLAQMKNNPLTQAIPVIVITALSESTIKEKALRTGAVAFLTKPVSPKLILDIVDNVINNNTPELLPNAG